MHGVTVTGALSWTVEKHASLVVGRIPPTTEQPNTKSAVETQGQYAF